MPSTAGSFRKLHASAKCIFAWPGIGDLMVNAIGARDFTLVQGITVVFVAGFLLVNLIVELLYLALNPRLRHA